MDWQLLIVCLGHKHNQASTSIRNNLFDRSNRDLDVNVIDFDVVHFMRCKVQCDQSSRLDNETHIYGDAVSNSTNYFSNTCDTCASSYWDQNVLNGMNQLCVQFDCTPPPCET
jgi:hypothetical protein